MEFSKLFKHCPSCGSSLFLENNKKSMRCSDCSFVFYLNASAATAAFIFNPQSDLLVCRRAKDPAKGSLDLPGGFVDGDETAEEAIVRELKEELNANVKNLRYCFSMPNKYKYSGLTVPTLDLFFVCNLTNIDHLKASDDVASFEFVPLSMLNPKLFGLQSIQKAVERLQSNASDFLTE